MNTQSIHDDISYLRKLAESGRNGPILGGMFLAAAGLIFGIACLISWGGYSGLLPIAPEHQYLIWCSSFAVFAAFWLVLFAQMRAAGGPGANSTSAGFGAIWGASGLGVMVVLVTTEIVANLFHDPAITTGFIPVIFAFYGTNWVSSAILAKRAWMYLAGAGSYVFAILMAFLAGTPYQVLAMAGGLFVLLSLPGFKLVADQARAKGL